MTCKLWRAAAVVVLALSLLQQQHCVSADGDLVRRLYKAEREGVRSSQLSISAKDLPAAITKRLATFNNLQWDSLSGLLQRAVIWDTGFVFATPTRLVQIYTSCSRTMADMHVDISLLERLAGNNTDCEILRCGVNNHFLVRDCPSDFVAPLARCAVDAKDMDGVAKMGGVVWAEDGQNPEIPDPVIRVHASTADGASKFNLYAIHLSDAAFSGSESCQLRGDFIVPCRDHTDTDFDLCEASAGATVDAWLRLASAPQSKLFSTAAIVCVGVLTSALLALVGLVFYMYKNRQNLKRQPNEPLITNGNKSNMLNSMDVFEAHARAEGGGSHGHGGDDTLSNDALCAKSIVLRRFVSDPTVITKRIAFSQLNFLRVLSKGANGEVWLGQFESRYVAVKCLLPTKRKDVRALEQFSEEIRLASMLEHPRIVAFCGIAWHSLVNLSIVTEYMEKGDLENFLGQPQAAEQLTWSNAKLTLAKDIADALVYLHSLVPVVIHRDLKSKNILLDNQIRAKLSDFGLSRESSSEETMTNGVGTILWSAPEVLEGKRYDEKADVFSYGIVLSEIDTCALPYGFNKDKTRNKMKSMQIVHMVAEGKLLPTFRDDCPPELVELARSCLDLDPAKRPSAMQIVFTLRSKLYPLMNKAVSSIVDSSTDIQLAVQSAVMAETTNGSSNSASATATPSISTTATSTNITSSASLPPLRSPVPLPSSPRGGIGVGVGGLKSLGGTTRQLTSNADTERKRRLLRRVPLLRQLLTDYATTTTATEDQIVQALRLVSYADGEYIYCQGQAERDLYFIEDGKVLITQRRAAANANGASSLASTVGMALSVAAVAATRPPAAAGSGSIGTGTPPRRRSVLDAQLEVQIHTHHELEFFGELALLQNKPMRTYNAVASGAVVCAVLSERDFDTLLKPVHALLLYRHLLRAHCVLEKDRMFKELSPTQRQYLIDRCSLEAYKDGELICRQGEIHDDRFFILAEGEADVLLEEERIAEFDTAVDSISSTTNANANANASSRDLVHRSMTTVVAHKSLFQSFGEMGLLDKPRTASVVAKGDVLCIVINRKQYIAATQLSGPTNALDADAEALLASTLMEEWKLVVNARNLHLSNPHVAHYLVTFIRQFKAAYNQKFAGKTLYLDFFRRLHQDPQLTDEFAFVASRIAWDSPSSSLGIIRSETRRMLTKPPAQRSPDETSFIGRLIEHTAFLSKFDVPGPHVDRYKLARCLARVVAFANIAKDTYLFRQGKIESRAFLILRGKINIVNEDVTTSTSTIKHYEVIATLSAGDSFGELSLVTRLQRSATTMAACDTDLLVFDRDHLQYVQSALPGVSVQQVMVKRAEFLSRLSFFKGSDFGQCIRVAHDLQEATHEARHLFLQDAAQQRSLYIVKSGEIAVFMKVQVATGASSATGGSSTTTTSRTKTVLVRVATIGAQEFFGVAIATVNTTATVPATTPAAGAAPSSSPAAAAAAGSSSSSPTKQWDLGAAVYMSTTRVVILELTERGWRRLSPQCLLSVRNALLERHQYNERVAQKHKSSTQQTKESGDAATPTTAAFYHVDKPWQQLHQPPISLTGGGNASCSVAASSTRPPSQLARHVKDKRTKASPYATLFPPHDRDSELATAAKATETRAVAGVSSTSTTTSPTTTASSATFAAWGWNSPFQGVVSPPCSPSSPPSPRQTSRPSAASSLSPLVSFASSTSPPVASLSLSLLPTPPRGDRHTLLMLANLSPRSAAAHHHHHQQQQTMKADPTKQNQVDHQQQHRVDDSGIACTSMWKTRTPAARRSDNHAP